MLTLKERGTKYWKRAEIALGVVEDEIFDLKSFTGAMDMLECVIKKSLRIKDTDEEICEFVFFVKDVVGYQMVIMVYNEEDKVYPIETSGPLDIDAAVTFMKATRNG